MYVEEPAPSDLYKLRTQNCHNISKTQYRDKSGLAEDNETTHIYIYIYIYDKFEIFL